METIRDIRRKIGSVKKIKQITRAMNMVAAAKLRKSQAKLHNIEPYRSKFMELAGRLSGHLGPDTHPLLFKREETKKVELLHFTGDRGLCGGFNAGLISMAEKWIKDKQNKGVDYSLTLIGGKGSSYFKRKRYNITSTMVDAYGDAGISEASHIGSRLIDAYMSGQCDEVYMLYMKFESITRQTPTIVRLIPVDLPQNVVDEKGPKTEYVCEPSLEGVLTEILPRHITIKIFNAFLENEAGEHAARMVAMDNSTKNCDDVLDLLTLTYNKIRQAAITSELMDIIGGAEAVKA
jgi:F-type H+-transporting ATPase subunit gamma